MQVHEVLSSLVPGGKAAQWDPVGLQIGDPAAEVKSVAVCHEVAEIVVDQVVADPPDLLVTYHPLLFRPTTTLIAGTSPGGRALRLARAGVNLAVVHTAFDVAAGGAADALAAAVGVESARGFGPLEGPGSVKIVTFVPSASVDEVFSAMSAAGAGSIGRYHGCSFRSEGVGTFNPSSLASPSVGSTGVLNEEPEVRLEMTVLASRSDAVIAALVAAHPYEEPAYDVLSARSNEGLVGRFGTLAEPVDLGSLAEIVESKLDSGSVRIAGNQEVQVAVVAVVPGSGGGLIRAAVAVGAEVIITGDVSHHQAVDALDRGIAVIDAGHAPTERPGMDRLYAAVADLPVEARDLTKLNTNPWGR